MSEIEYQRSAGFILYKDDGERKYLLLHHGGNYWNFPKGKLEKDESEMEAAIRELEEETRLTNIRVVENFGVTFEYSFKHKEFQIEKEVKIFLAEYLGDKIILSREHRDYGWFMIERAMEILKFSNVKKALKKADDFLSDL